MQKKLIQPIAPVLPRERLEVGGNSLLLPGPLHQHFGGGKNPNQRWHFASIAPLQQQSVLVAGTRGIHRAGQSTATPRSFQSTSRVKKKCSTRSLYGGKFVVSLPFCSSNPLPHLKHLLQIHVSPSGSWMEIQDRKQTGGTCTNAAACREGEESSQREHSSNNARR